MVREGDKSSLEVELKEKAEAMKRSTRIVYNNTVQYIGHLCNHTDLDSVLKLNAIFKLAKIH